MTQPSPSLDATAVRDLVALRLMLDDATRRASVAHPYTRGTAVVALDAAVERVAYLVALRRNVNVAPRDTLGDLHSKLVQSLGSAWAPTMWAQVRNLHEARNGAQHKSLVPAGEDVPGWTAAARAYVTSLVEAEYQVDLDRVVLADAVQSEPLADLIRAAEAALTAGDIRTSVEAGLQAFDAAVNAWSRMHGRDRHRPAPTFHPELGFMGHDTAGKAIGRLQRTAAEASFASSAAEHEWFTSTRKESVELLDADDAERLLAFTFSWVVSLELATSQWVPDRRRRADIAERQVRTTAGHASISRIRPVRHRPPITDVTFELADVPDQDLYPHWAATLAKLLDGPKRGRWWVGADGTVTLTKSQATVPEGADLDTLVVALFRVEDAIAAEITASVQAADDLTADKGGRERDVEALRHQLPDWVETLTFDHRKVAGTEQGWRLTITPEAGGLRFPNPGGVPDVDVGVWNLIRTEEVHCIITGTNEARLPSTLNAEQVVAALRGANEQVCERRLETAREREGRDQVVGNIQADLAAALARAKQRP